MKTRSVVVLLLAMAGSALSAFGQTVSFRADQVTVPPSVLTRAGALRGGTTCVQVGIYMSTADVGTAENWQQVTMNLGWTLSGGAVLAGDPVVEVSDFVGTNNPAETGIATPGDPIAGSTCAAGDIANVATLGGAAANYMGNAAVPASAGGGGFATENVNAGLQTITVGRLDTNDIFQTNNGEEYLVAIVSFPVDNASPLGSVISVDFTAGAGQNIINRPGREAIDGDGQTTNGYIAVFDDQDCTGATVADDQGPGTGTTIDINYLDPMAGGIGGDITLTMPHAGNDPAQIRVVPNDGTAPIVLTGAQIGAGSTTLALSTQGDGTPATSQSSVSYQIFYGNMLPAILGGALSEGAPCTVTVNWAAATCTVVFDPAVTPPTTDVDVNVTLNNVIWNGTSFGTLTSTATDWPGDVNLTAPAVAGTTLSFTPAIMLPNIDGGEVGDYSVSAAGPGTGNNAACSETLIVGAPMNDVDCAAIPTGLQIGGNVVIPLAGSNVITWDITYNGITVNVPGTDTTFDLMNLVGNVTQVMIAANGFDLMGNPTSVPVTCDLAFADPTCAFTPGMENPSNCPDGVDLGTVLTISVDTVNALAVAMGGVALTPSVDPATNANVTWTGSFTVVSNSMVTVTTSGATGTTDNTDCSFETCLNTFITDGIVNLNPDGIEFTGTPDKTWEIYAVPVSGSGCVVIDPTSPQPLSNFPGAVLVGSVTTNSSGAGTGVFGSGIDFQEDVCYYGVCEGVVYGGTRIATVPTLGQWGLIAFAFLLMVAGVVNLRKRRLA